MNTDLDVLVIGGGPVGLFAAHELCRHGLSPKRIKIIDKRIKQKLWCKAVAIQSRTQEIIYGSNNELSNELQSITLKVNNASLYRYPPNCMDDDKSFKDNELIVSLNMNGMRSQFKNMAVTEQYNTENLIAKQLNLKYNVQLQRGIELFDFTDKGSYIEVKLRPYRGKNVSSDDFKEDEIEILRVKYLIGCDGAHSFVRQKLNLPFIGETFPEDFVLFHGELNENHNIPPIAMFINGRNGILGGFTLKDGTFYLFANLNKEQSEELNKRHNGKMKQPSKDDIEWLLQQRGMNGVTIKSTKWTSAFKVESRQITQYSKGRVYLAGDACHIHSPAMGQGMNMGLQDAANLSWKLAMVINKKCSASLLCSYNTERYSVDKDVVRRVDLATNAMTVRSPFGLFISKKIQKLLAGNLRFLLDAQIQSTGQIAYSYKDNSELSFEYWKPLSLIPFLLYRRQQNITRLIRHRLRAGDRCPDFVIPYGNDKEFVNKNLYELFRETVNKPFVILIFEGSNDPYWRVPFTDHEDLNQFKRKIESSQIGDYCKVVIIPSIYERLNELFGVYQQCLFLIRPDQYIGLRSQPLSMDALKYYLCKKLYINDIRIGDDEANTVKNIERIDPLPSVLLTGLLLGIGYFVGNKVLPQQYKPNGIVDKLFHWCFE